MRTPAAALVLVLAGACASAGAIVPATNQSVTSGLALGDYPESAGDAWLDNRSSVAVRVVGITLHECINIQQACDKRIPLDVKVESGTREFVFKVLRHTPYEAYKVTFFAEWRPDTIPASRPPAH